MTVLVLAVEMSSGVDGSTRPLCTGTVLTAGHEAAILVAALGAIRCCRVTVIYTVQRCVLPVCFVVGRLTHCGCVLLLCVQRFRSGELVCLLTSDDDNRVVFRVL